MSKKKEFPRLQGEAWHALKHTLTPCDYMVNDNNHIKGFYKDDSGKIYTHWLNDQEIEDYNMAIGGRKWRATKSLAEEFEKRQNIKAKTHTTISTSIQELNEAVAEWKRKHEQKLIDYAIETKQYGKTAKEIDKLLTRIKELERDNMMLRLTVEKLTKQPYTYGIRMTGGNS